jgi:hypothetical protein
MLIFRFLPRSERSVQVRGIPDSFVTCQDSTMRNSQHFSQPPKLVNHPLSVAGDRLFSTFAAALRILKPSSLPTTWRRTMSWWQEFIYHGTRYPSEWHCIFTAPRGPRFVRITQPTVITSRKYIVCVHSNAHKVIAGFFLSPDPEVT